MDDQTNAPAPTNPDDVQDKAVEVSQGMVNGQADQPAADMPAAPSDQGSMPGMPSMPASDGSSTDAPAPAPMSEPGGDMPAPEAPAENTPESTPPAV